MARSKLPEGHTSNVLVAGYVEDGVKASGAKCYRRATAGEDPTIYRATVRYRAANGTTKTAEAWHVHKSKAEARVRANAARYLEEAGRALDPTMTVAELGEAWLSVFAAKGSVRPQTLGLYASALNDHVAPSLGGWELRELTTGKITAALDAMAKTAPSNARFSRVVLKHMIDYAIQHDALEQSPVDKTPTYSSSAASPKALTVDQLMKVRQAVSAWQEARRSGPPRGRNTLDVLDFMLGAGCRTGEALAVRWEDVRLGENPTVTFTGTIITPRHKGKVYRQPLPKSKSGFRTVHIPRHVANMLMRRAGEEDPGELGLVFASRDGGIMSPNNFRRGLRQALKEADLEGFYPYLLRKTAATAIARADGMDAAAATLGHSSPSVTAKHYAERNVEAPDVAATVQRLFDALV